MRKRYLYQKHSFKSAHVIESLFSLLLVSVAYTLNNVDHVGRGGGSDGLKVVSIRHRNISSSDTSRRSIEVVESLLIDDGDNLSTNTMLGPTLFDGDKAVGLLHTVDNGITVKRTDRTEVDDLGADSLGLKKISSLESDANITREGDNSNISTLTHDLSLTDVNGEVGIEDLLGHGESLSVENLTLEEDNWIRVTDRSLEETDGILGIIRSNNLETGAGSKPGGETLRVLGTDGSGGTVGSTEHNRDLDLTTGHVTGLGSRVDDVINGLEGKVHGHELTDGLQTSLSGTNSETGETHLGNRSINNSLLLELVDKSLGHLVSTMVTSNFLTKDEDLIITNKLLLHGVVESITDGHLSGEGITSREGAESSHGRLFNERNTLRSRIRSENTVT